MKNLKKVFFIEVGTILFAIAVGLFLLPGNILTGGVAGIVSLIKPYYPFCNISEDILTIIISTSLFIVGAIFLDKTFTYQTLIHSVSYPFVLLLVTRYLPEYEIDPILAAIYGGVIGGAGIGIIFRQGGSTGGMDVIPLIIEKHFKLEASKGIMILDAITVIAGLFIYGINSVLIGLISVFFTSFTMERVINLYNGVEARRVEIISDKFIEINNDIQNLVERGTTIIDGKGGYTNNDKKILLVVVSSDELEKLIKIVNNHDSSAFVIISEVKDVHGEGFTIEPRL